MRTEEFLAQLSSHPGTKARLEELPFSLKLEVSSDRCFLLPKITVGPRAQGDFDSWLAVSMAFTQLPELHTFDTFDAVQAGLLDLIHLPGLRGNPERAYPTTQAGSRFPGTFEKYVASMIARWQESGASRELEGTREDLALLGLTWTVSAQRLSDTHVGLQVGRTSKGLAGDTGDLVDIADVGFGVSQVLPVLVALQAARPGQLVYIEQPELHLHPRAQSALASVLARAARRGVRVVAETHSALLLLGTQTLVARGELAGEDVQLHWFSRNADGYTQLRSTTLDETGAFGDWPEDFAETTLRAQAEYLDAVEEATHKP
jgi:hypothetical protein